MSYRGDDGRPRDVRRGGKAGHPASPGVDAGAPLPPAGWYQDPMRSGGQRFWDGRNWTGQTATTSLLAARWWRRAAGTVLDALLLTPGTAVVTLTAVGYLFGAAHGVDARRLDEARAALAAVAAASLVAAVYGTLMLGLRGQTVGMAVAGCEVADASSGEPIGLRRSLFRALVVLVLVRGGIVTSTALTLSGNGTPPFAARILWALSALGALVTYLWPLGNPARQTLHDKLARSVVLSTRARSRSTAAGLSQPRSRSSALVAASVVLLVGGASLAVAGGAHLWSSERQRFALAPGLAVPGAAVLALPAGDYALYQSAKVSALASGLDLLVPGAVRVTGPLGPGAAGAAPALGAKASGAAAGSRAARPARIPVTATLGAGVDAAGHLLLAAVGFHLGVPGRYRITTAGPRTPRARRTRARLAAPLSAWLRSARGWIAEAASGALLAVVGLVMLAASLIGRRNRRGGLTTR